MDNKELTTGGRPKPPAAGRGRKKGELNKLTRSAKEAFQFAFDKIGGAENLAIWATENTTEFYKLFARLIPVEQQISGKDGKELNFTLFVPPKA
jgi:hypothetical protein